MYETLLLANQAPSMTRREAGICFFRMFLMVASWAVLAASLTMALHGWSAAIPLVAVSFFIGVMHPMAEAHGIDHAKGLPGAAGYALCIAISICVAMNVDAIVKGASPLLLLQVAAIPVILDFVQREYAARGYLQKALPAPSEK